MAMWQATENTEEAAGSEELVRRYTETVMDMLEKSHGGGQDARGEDELATKKDNKWKKCAETDAYWDSQYAAPNAMQQYGFCKTGTHEYPSSQGSAGMEKPGVNLGSQGIPLSEDAPGMTSIVEGMDQGASHLSLSSPPSSSASKRRVAWEGLLEKGADAESRFLDEREAAEKGEPVPVLDGRAAVRRTLLDDIAAKRTLRKLSTLTALVEKQKNGDKKQDVFRLPRVALITLRARTQTHWRTYEPQAVLCQFPGDCFSC